MTLEQCIWQLTDLNDNNSLPGDDHNEAVEYAIAVLEAIRDSGA